MKPRALWALVLLIPGYLVPGAMAQERQQPLIIRKITIQGLRRLSEPSVAAKLKIRIGQPYDARAVSEETGRLFKMGDFSRVEDPEIRYFEDGLEVLFKVEEKPRVAAVKFEALDTLTGKPSLGQRDLQDAISTRPDGRLSMYSVKSDADKIRRTYQEKGYPFVEVSTQTKERPAGVDVTFLISEGSPVRIHEIDFVGNKSIPAGDLRKVMETRTRDFLFGLINPGYYSEQTLSRDLVQITRTYHDKGFFEARAAVEDFQFDPSLERLRLVIRIDEGPRYTFRGYEFEGNRIFSTQVLAPLVRSPVGQPYDEERMQEDRKEIAKYYQDRAYIYCKVDPQYLFFPAGTDVRIRFKIEEGNEITIEHILIRKNVRTQDRVIRRELEFYPGEKVNYSKLDKSKSNLSRLQIFKDVRFNFETGSSPEKRNAVVEVDEESTGRLIFGFGLSSGYGIIGNVSLLKRNFDITDVPESFSDIPDSFTGAGQVLNIAVMPGTRRSLYRLNFMEPYLFETRNSFALSGAISTIIRDDYDETRMTFDPQIGHAFDFDRDLVFSIGSRIEQVEISHIDRFASPDVFAAKGTTSIIALNSALTYDTLLVDRWEGPYQGHRERLGIEYGGEPLGGQLDFYKADSTLELYFPIYVHEEGQLHHVIGLFSKAGLIEGHHSTEEIPIFERFILGGPNTVRGFEFRGLGPQFRGDAMGGTAIWYGNLEYVFPLFMKYLRGVVFLDYGNLAPDLESFSLDEMRISVGGGVRITFPFFGGPLPIGLYLGYALKHEDFDRTQLFLFSIGVPF